MICRGDSLGSQDVVLCDGRCLTEPPRTVLCDHSPLRARVSSLISSDLSSIGLSVSTRLTKVYIEGLGDVPMHHMQKSAMDAYYFVGPAMKDWNLWN